jgi:hypothetical protein
MFKVIPIMLNIIKEIKNDSGIEVAVSSIFKPKKSSKIL